jgi:molybdate transport system substrate-binding protein
MLRRRLIALLAAACAGSPRPGFAAADPLVLLTSGAFRRVAEALCGQLQATTGATVTIASDTAGGVLKRIAAGASVDVVVATQAGIAELVKAGRVEAASAVDLARVGIGVAVRAGAPHPDIATVEDFRRALLAATSIAYIDPAAGGTSGIAIAALLARLGIADLLRTRTILVNGGLVADEIADGRAEIGLQQLSELTGARGVEVVGALPAEVQSYTTYAGGVLAASPRQAQARALLAALAPPGSVGILHRMGMDGPAS